MKNKNPKLPDKVYYVWRKNKNGEWIKHDYSRSIIMTLEKAKYLKKYSEGEHKIMVGTITWEDYG